VIVVWVRHRGAIGPAIRVITVVPNKSHFSKAIEKFVFQGLWAFYIPTMISFDPFFGCLKKKVMDWKLPKKGDCLVHGLSNAQSICC